MTNTQLLQGEHLLLKLSFTGLNLQPKLNGNKGKFLISMSLMNIHCDFLSNFPNDDGDFLSNFPNDDVCLTKDISLHFLPQVVNLTHNRETCGD